MFFHFFPCVYRCTYFVKCDLVFFFFFHLIVNKFVFFTFSVVLGPFFMAS